MPDNVARIPANYSRSMDIKFPELQELFNKAESSIKSVEIEIGFIPTPPLNELRYAAKHLVDAIELQALGKDFQEQIDRAKRHCHRAIYDAYEIPIMEYIVTLNHYFKSYDVEIVVLYIPKYAEHLETWRNVQGKFEEIEASGDRDGNENSRHTYSEWCIKHRNELKAICNDFEKNELLIRKKTKKVQNKERLQAIAALGGLLSVFLAAAKFLFG